MFYEFDKFVITRMTDLNSRCLFVVIDYMRRSNYYKRVQCYKPSALAGWKMSSSKSSGGNVVSFDSTARNSLHETFNTTEKKVAEKWHVVERRVAGL